MGDRREGSPGPLRYRLWAGGLHKDITPEEVQRKMERFGEVIDVRIRSSPRDTFAFVQFTSQKAIELAVEKMDNSTSLGEKVRVAMATENAKKSQDNNNRRCDSRDAQRGRDPRGDRRGGFREDDRPDDRQGSYRNGRRGESQEYDRGARGGDCRGGRREDFRDDGRRGGPRGGDPRYDDDDDDRRMERPSRCDSRGRRQAGRTDYRRRDAPSYDDEAFDAPRGRRDGSGGGGRCDRGNGDRQRHRSRTPRDPDGVVRYAGKVPVGRHKITIENLPDDMSWLELKDLGRDYGPSLTFARTYRHGDNYYGMLEFKDRNDADIVIGELNNRRVQGSKERLRASYGSGPGGD
mmetsp:Transcript_86710/g.245874  ORF Transcript_86710/g.245874 Transcript_86710/m.245874 type:complete len:349 (-) Transcript_86710:154-1200(-)